MRTGIAHLPLHAGRAPRWLFERRHSSGVTLGLHVAGGKGALSRKTPAETPASTRDPARFSFAHGGRHGHPYPVDRVTYDRTIEVLKRSLDRGRLDHSEKVAAPKRVATFSARAQAKARGRSRDALAHP